ncbi:MAG: hypothetical protein Q7T32_00840 [Moraxellaceae bacterium]|nr:hypothetical protein [Moraxellaceae bacterium]
MLALARILFTVTISSAAITIDAAASAPAGNRIDSDTCRPVQTGPGPHSLIQVNGSTVRLLVSSHDRRNFEKTGDIYDYQPSTGTMRPLPRTGEPRELSFRPHHTDIYQAGSETLLYVINHDDGKPNSRHHSILVYAIQPDRLVFKKRLRDPLLSSPNHLSISPGGDIYVSNDRRDGSSVMELVLRQKKATIVHYRENSGWRIVAAGLSFPNGIEAETSRVLVSKTFGSALLEFPRKPDGSLGMPRRVISLPLLDGLTPAQAPDHYLVISHASLVDFLQHKNNGAHRSPATVHEVNMTTGRSRIFFEDDGRKISGISAAVTTSDAVYFGQSFEPFLLRCPHKNPG